MIDIAVLDFNYVYKMSYHLYCIFHTDTWEGEVYHLQVIKHQLKVYLSLMRWGIVLVDAGRQHYFLESSICKPNPHMHVPPLINNRALTTGTKTGFTGASGFTVVSRELHTAHRICALHCWTGSYALSWSTVTQHSTQPGSGSRPCGGKWFIDLKPRSTSDPDPKSDVESPIMNVY